MRPTFPKLVAFLLAGLAFPSAASAQSAWLEQEGTGIALEYRRLSADDLEDLDLLSGAYFLVGQYELARGSQIVVEVPWARVDADEEGILGDEDAESLVGNVYLGFARRPRGGSSGFDIGLRLPTVGEDANSAAFLGNFSTLIDHIGAYWPETLSFIGGVGGSTKPAEHTELRARAGLTYLHYMGDGNEDGEAYARLTGQAITRIDAVRFGGGVETLFFLTGESGNAGERSLVALVLIGGYDFGGVLAGLQFHLPIDDDYKEFADHVLGLSVEVALP